MSDMSMNQRRDDWQAGVLGDLTGTPQTGTPQPQHAPQGPLPVQPHAPLPQQPAPAPPQQAPARPYAPQAAQARAPETVPVPGADAPAGRPRHGDPLTRRTLRTLRGALGSSVAKAVAAETELATQVQQPVTTGRQIVVTSIRGGSGKTTVTALLSRTYNHFRHDPVLTLEADAALGTLPVRLGVPSLRWTCADLAQILRPSMQLTDVTGYLVPLADGGWLLPGSQGRIGAQVDVATYRTVMVALRRYFGVTVVDCETLPGEVARTALDTAHARVLTAPATAEGLVSTHAVLDWLGSLPVPVLPRTVVVLTVQSPNPAVDLGRAAEKLRATGAGVVVLPYDRHLASGGAVRSELLGFQTREAAMRLAADVLQRAVALPASGAAR
ncbi:MinD/ParA family protein [Streptomyces sp. NPDC090077]|uniref:MinD/ParA family ATP-binding protein n=1 Tax=Streptomyces sp. NPDC090077 TaxID=3365938 RepID=UPI00380ED549